jgi:putative transcriptional regulator
MLWFGFFSISGDCVMNNRIKEYRVKFDLTQEELAKKVNVRRETIVFLEKNKYNPSLKLAFDLARVFSVTIEELFYFENQ